MYSVVLATMLAAGANTPDWGWHGYYGYGWYGYSGWGWPAYGFYGYGYGWPGYAGYGYGWPYGYGYGGGYYGYPYYYGWGGYGWPGYWPYYGGYYGGYPWFVSAESAKPGDKQTAAKEAPAKVIVQMPANAKLFVEGKPVKLDQKTGSFTSPNLQKGDTYVYTLKAEVVRDGKKVSESKDVHVWAGKVSEVQFEKLAPPAVANK